MSGEGNCPGGGVNVQDSAIYIKTNSWRKKYKITIFQVILKTIFHATCNKWEFNI